MTTNTTRYDLVEIDARARQMRADMMAAAVRSAIAWFRKPRAQGVATRGQTA